MPHLTTGIRGSRAALMAVALALCSFAPARAAEFYFVMVFGSQRALNNPNYSHSWATFVRATGAGPCPRAYRLEAHTISWLPENMVVRTHALLPECGRNFDLHTTIRHALGNDERVSMWGPYLIDPELYGRALKQIELLESGRVKYKAVDAGHRSDHVSNCIHAVSSISEGHRLRIVSPLWGEPASYFIARELEPWVIDDDARRFTWVSSALGLDWYPVIYRDLEAPCGGPLRSAVRRALGIVNAPPAAYGPPR